MSDLPKRLREWAYGLRNMELPFALAHEAADEIVRLTSQLAAIHEHAIRTRTAATERHRACGGADELTLRLRCEANLLEMVTRETAGMEFAQKLMLLQVENDRLRLELADCQRRVPLSITDARLQHVCRFCRKPDKPRRIRDWIDPFVYDYGEEYAHESCIRRAKEESVVHFVVPTPIERVDPEWIGKQPATDAEEPN